MKSILSIIAGLTLSGSALAHSSVVPHTHAQATTNWGPGFACGAALATAVWFVLRRRRKTGGSHR